MFVVEREAGQRKGARVFDVDEIRKGKQCTTKQGNGSPVCGEGKNCPRKAPRRREGWSSAFEIVERGLQE